MGMNAPFFLRCSALFLYNCIPQKKFPFILGPGAPLGPLHHYGVIHILSSEPGAPLYYNFTTIL